MRARLTNKTVLIVDDEPDIRELLTFLLQDFGCRVIQANDAETAFALAKKERLDVVITDMTLPGENGLELLKRMRRRFPLVPVLIITGAPDIWTPHSLANGAAAVFEKPFDTMAFLEAVLLLLTDGESEEMGELLPATN